MRFCLLGVLRAYDGDRAIAVPATRQRILLAALLLRLNHPVPLDELADIVWHGEPPRSWELTLRTYVMRLRKTLGEAASCIVTGSSSYSIVLDPLDLDIHACEHWCRLGDIAARTRRPAEAAAHFRHALSLFTAAPLADVPSAQLRGTHAAHLGELRWHALDGRIAADVLTDPTTSVVAELRSLIAEEPFRESLHGQLMLALYRRGRQADALDVYRQLRHLLISELGVEPTASVEQLHRRILDGDAALLGSDPSADGRSRPNPAQLPAAAADFTGRHRELTALRRAVTASTTVATFTIVGTGGVGKTALALHLAHEIRDRFPDGQLFIDLHGAGANPVPATEALARLLRDLGQPAADVPSEMAERAALYRTVVAQRRILIVLDNARDAAHVTPLIPGTAGCAVLVTARNTLPGLASNCHVQLEPLNSSDAARLLQTLLGGRSAAQEPAAIATVMRACAGLPLAIQIVARRLRSRPSWTLASLADRLDDHRRHLDELAAGELAVRTSFRLSYDALEAEDRAAARAFRLLGLSVGNGWSVPAAAALIGTTIESAERLLEHLSDMYLVQAGPAERYGMHDLVAAYALERADADELEHDASTARRRMVSWYLAAAEAASQTINPHRRGTEPCAGVAIAVPSFADRNEALGFYEVEQDNLIACCRLAAEKGWHDIAWRLPVALWEMFFLRGRVSTWIEVLTVGLGAARSAGDRSAEARILSNLGAAYGRDGQTSEAARVLTTAVAIARQLHDPLVLAPKLANLGVVYGELDRFDESIRLLHEALHAFHGAGQVAAIAKTHNNIAWVNLRSGRLSTAIDEYRWALRCSRRAGDDYSRGQAEAGLSETFLAAGRLANARRFAERAVITNRAVGARRVEAEALRTLGDAIACLGNADAARPRWWRAIGILEELGDRTAAEIRADLDAGRPSRVTSAASSAGARGSRQRR